MTSAALIYSVPRSTPITAEAAEAVDEKRKVRPRRIVAGERRALRRPGGAIVCVKEDNVSLSAGTEARGGVAWAMRGSVWVYSVR